MGISNIQNSGKGNLTMESKKSSRERLIEASGYLFRVRGYNNTSIADIAAACNLRKASIYHHISSKKELGIAVLTLLSKEFDNNVFNIAYDEAHSEKERLTAFAHKIVDYFTNREGGCLMGNLSLESVGQIPEFETIIKSYFNNWIDAVTHLLSHRYGSEEAKSIAEDTVSWCQGAIMMCRIFGNYTPLTRFKDQVVALLETKSKKNITDSSVTTDIL